MNGSSGVPKSSRRGHTLVGWWARRFAAATLDFVVAAAAGVLMWLIADALLPASGTARYTGKFGPLSRDLDRVGLGLLFAGVVAGCHSLLGTTRWGATLGMRLAGIMVHRGKISRHVVRFGVNAAVFTGALAGWWMLLALAVESISGDLPPPVAVGLLTTVPLLVVSAPVNEGSTIGEAVAGLAPEPRPAYVR